MKIRRIWVRLAALVLGVVLLSGCQNAATTTNGKMNVVTSVDFYAEVAKAVGGQYTHVTSVINDPAVDPHDYEPTTNVGKQVAEAAVVIDNGAGYDSWMSKLINANSAQIETVSAAKVVGVKDGENEHVWYKPQAMPALANALATAYARKDPQHRQQYQANAKKYINSLKPLNSLIDRLRTNAKGHRVAVSEPVFNNALQYMGYKVSNEHFAQAIEEGTDPSPADIRLMKTDFSEHKVAFFVLNTQVDNKVVTNMVQAANKAHIPVLRVTETLPAHETYTTWMMRQYNDLAAIQAKTQ